MVKKPSGDEEQTGKKGRL